MDEKWNADWTKNQIVVVIKVKKLRNKSTNEPNLMMKIS